MGSITISGRRTTRRDSLSSILLVCFMLLSKSNAFRSSHRHLFFRHVPATHITHLNRRMLAADAMTVTKNTQRARALSGMWSQDDEIRGSDRIKACVPYLLPLMDGDHFGKFIYARIPPLAAIDEITIGPLAELAHTVPFLSLGLFIALTLGTRFNSEMSRNLRFSAQQAALIDVALLFPELISTGFEEDPLPRYIAEPCSNFVWYAYMSVILYCIHSNLRGKKPDQIPFVSSAAETMVGPF